MSDETKCVITLIGHDDEIPEDVSIRVREFLREISSTNWSTKQLSSRCYEFTFNIKSAEYGNILQKVKSECLNQTYDLILQKLIDQKGKKLFVFDMDSTLIYQEVIELIASYANIEDKVAEITERAMNGELDFNESLRERVLLLKGINSTNIWKELEQKIEITNGVKPLTKALKKLGCYLAVCSGGFIPLAEHIKNELGLDYAYANTLGVDEENILNGETIGEIVNGDKKAELLLEIAAKHGIDPKQAVAIGDGANDLKMMSVAGFGIAWNAKPKVQLEAPSCLNTKSLLDVLYIMGYTQSEIEDLII
ncbi:SER2 [Candida pseudojiufengensis]|uniref:SER2 n=1 Tax=Candida pseudojiufengensis TaxID=497109 RepID=UPI002225845F|nr:SER2 [Candida pseudojiufengensis]KAI5964699.1 SER2 [Candida pseudojiufengensis]